MDTLKLAFVNDYARDLLSPDHRTDMVFGGLHIFRAMKVKRILRSG
jgi:hypothetical protein